MLEGRLFAIESMPLSKVVPKLALKEQSKFALLQLVKYFNIEVASIKAY